MLKAHCDNCDAVIGFVKPAQRVSVQPHGYQCDVTVMVEKTGVAQQLCLRCLGTAALEFAKTMLEEAERVTGGAR